MATPKPRPAAPPIPEETRRQVIRFLTAGLPIPTAARLADVEEPTLEQWREHSRQNTTGYDGFEDEIQKALAEGEEMHVTRIAEAGKQNWRASAWLLERMYPQRWALPDRQADNGETPTQTNDLPGL